MKDSNMKIKETIKTRDGKLVYCLQVEQGELKLQLYIKNGEIYFEGCNYGFDNYPTFDFNNEAQQLAKSVFINSLKTNIQNKIVELKQLQLILDEIGLSNIIDKDIEEGSFLLNVKRKLLGN